MTDTNQSHQDPRNQNDRDSLQEQARSEATKNEVDNISPETDLDREQQQHQTGNAPQPADPD